LAAPVAPLQNQQNTRRRLASGELGMDIENMRPKLEQLGLAYYDRLDQVPGQELR
jgi:4-hydroxy-4-methyl-2-oxoglutarate aldolase